MSFKAKGLLLPSLPDIVPVKLKDPSVVDLVCVFVAPAATVTESKGSAPVNTHDIAKLFVKAIVLPPPDTVLFGILILLTDGPVLPPKPLLGSVIDSNLISVLLRFTNLTPMSYVPALSVAVPILKTLVLDVVLVVEVNVVELIPVPDIVIEKPEVIFSKLLPTIVAIADAAAAADELKDPVLLPGFGGCESNSELGK
jgi:hypothetical protein